MRKLIISTIVAVGWMFLGASAVSAAVLNKTYDRVYTMDGDHVHVTETTTATITDPNYYIAAGSKEVFTIFNPILKDTQATDKINKAQPTIKVTDANGKDQQFTTQVDGQDILVYVTRPQDITYVSPHKLKIEYDSYSLSSRNGMLYDLYVPSFDKDFKFNDDTTNRTFNTKVLIPKSLGELNLVTPDKAPADAGDKWEINFSQQDLTGTLSWIQIGTTQYYQFSITQPFPSSTNIPVFFNTFSVLLPRNISESSVTQDIIFSEISPKPDSVVTDANGNLVANFIVPANQAGEIKISGYATTKHNLKVNIKDSGKLSDIPAAILQQNIQPAQFWEVNASPIQEAANQLKQGTDDVYQLISKTYQFVVDKINYDEVKRFGLNERQGALKTLLQGSGVCMEYSDLFITLMRAAGVPARGAFGYGYDSRATNGEDAAHQWAEVYIPKLDSWVAVDTTWGESGPAVIGGDLNHFYKYVASVDPNTPSPVEVAYFGTLGAVKDESFSIQSLETAPTVSGQTEQDLLTLYPVKSPITQKWEGFTRSVNLATSTVDTKFGNILMTNLHVASDSVSMMKTVSYILIVVLIIGVAGTVIYRRRKHKAITPVEDTLADPVLNT